MRRGRNDNVVRRSHLLVLLWMGMSFALHSCSGKVAQVAAGAAAVSPVQIVTTTIQGIQVGEVKTSISTIGGAQPLTYTIASGALPKGLVLDKDTGIIEGLIAIENANENYAFTAKVFDSGGNSSTRKFSGKIAPGTAELSFITTQLAAMSAGVGYAFAIQMTGGVKPYKFAITSGALPTGLTFNRDNGLISGTPGLTTGGKNFIIAIKGTDALDQTVMTTFQSTVNPNPTGVVQILSNSIPGIALGPVLTGISTSGGALPLTFSIVGGALPSGLSMDPTTGVISGTVPISAANTSYGFSVMVRDSIGIGMSRSFTGIIPAGSAILNFATNSIPAVAAGINYIYQVPVTGGLAPYTFTINSGSLPAGLTLSPTTGIISGTPSLSSGSTSYSFTLRVSDNSGQTKNLAIVGNVNPNLFGLMQILTTNLAGMAVGSYSYGISTSGGTPPLTFSISSGSLPTGLTLNSATGQISGSIPIAAGNSNYGFSVAVTDATGATTSRSYSGIVDPGDTILSMVTTEISPVSAGTAYSFTLAVRGGLLPYVFAVTGGALPAGLSLNTVTGEISGTAPLTSGGQAYSVSISVTDQLAQSRSVSLVGNIQTIPLTPIQITSTSILGVAVGTVATGINVSGGKPPLTFALAGGSLPSGLSLNTSTGAITGVIGLPDANTNFGFSVSVTDATGAVDTKSFTGVIDPGSLVLSLVTTDVSNFTAGVNYNFPVTVLGGSPPYNFSISSGSLPIGTSINSSTGLISGTPSITSGGSAYSFTIRVSDSLSQARTLSIVGNVGNNPTPPVRFTAAADPGFFVGPIVAGIPITGGVMPVSFSVTSGELPTGLSLNSSTGVITGTIPIASGGTNYGFSITVADATGSSDIKSFTGTIDPGDSVLKINSSTLAAFSAGINYSFPLTVTGGTLPYTFSITSGALPDGVTLNTISGLISGRPTFATAGTSYSFSVRVTDDGGLQITKTYIGTVDSSSIANMSITNTTIPTPVAGRSYAASMTVSGGTSPYTFSVSSGTLPGGLSLDTSTGSISGTVNLSARNASYLFVIRVTDSNSLIAEKTYSGAVGDYLINMNPTTLVNGLPSGAYSTYLATSGGQSPYTFSRTSGNLPSGLTLNTSTGLIGGVIDESEAGITRNFTIQCTDANGVQTTVNYSFTTGSFVVSMTTASLANATEGVAYSNASTALSASGGTGPYTYEYTGTLPSGVGLTSAGVFFGTPAINSGNTAPGTSYSITVRARDSLNQISSPVNLTLRTVVSSPVVDSLTPTQGVLGSGYSYTVTASGGRAPYTFAVTLGSLPSGLTINDTGTISGIPITTVDCPAGQFTVRVTDALSQISSASIKCITTLNGVLITTGGLPAATVGQPYSTTLSGTGGTPPYTYSAPNLPTGFSLVAATGELKSTLVSATPGSYTLYITITDSSGTALQSTRPMQISVINLISFTGATLSRGAVGVPYNSGSGVQLAATGGQASGNSYIYKLTSGSLPAGLSLSTGGLISGTPTNAAASYGGSYTFGVIATDDIGNVSQAASFTIVVSIPPKIMDTTMPPAVVGVPYAYDIKRTGGVNLLVSGSNATQLTYTVSGLGSSGVTYSPSTGRISGIPTTAGTYSVGVTITDQYGFSGSRNLVWTVRNAGKNLDLKTARISDPCTGMNQCNPGTAAISNVTNTSQQFLISQRTDTTPRSLQIAKIDAKGRIPLAISNYATGTTLNNTVVSLSASNGLYVGLAINGATIPSGTTITAVNSGCSPTPCVVMSNTAIPAASTAGVVISFGTGITTSNVVLPTRPTSVQPGFVRVADMDQDGYKDIVFNDNPNKSICVMWNSGSGGLASSDAFGMPTGFSAASTNCFPIPPGANGGNQPNMFQISDSLRPDNTNYGAQDIMVTSMNANNESTFYVLRNNCPAGGSCTGTRSTIFRGYGSATGNTTASNNTINSLSSTSGLAVGVPIVGPNIPSNTTITAINSGCGTLPCIAMSQNANSTISGATITWAAGTTLSGTSTTGSNVFTTASTSGISVGQLVSGANYPAGTTVRSFVTNTSVTMSSASTSGVTASVLVFGPTAHTPLIGGVAGQFLSYLYDIGFGWFTTSRPNLPAVKAQNANECPGIVIAGTYRNNNALSYWYVVRQSWTGSECAGDFATHNASDELLISNSAAYPSYIVANDFNSDGLTDIVTSLSNNMTSSNSIRGYVNGNTGNSLTGGSEFSTRLQSRGSATVGADAIISYCLDGSSSCTYPSLAVRCTRGTNSTTQDYGCLSVIPNQCTTPGCSSPFESSTPSARIDYPSSNGGLILPAPLVSTSNATPTGTITNGSTTISGVSSTSNIQAGQPITCIDGACNDTMLTFTADVRNTTTINNISTAITSQLQAGQRLTCISAQCALIPANTFIASVSAGSITINQNASGSASPVNVTLIAPKSAVAPVYVSSSSITNGSAVISGIASTTNIQIGQPVTCVTANCVALPANAYVVAKTSSTVLLNTSAIATQAGAILSIPQSVIPPYAHVTSVSASSFTISHAAVTGSTLTGAQVSVPTVPNRLDIGVPGVDSRGYPYFLVMARNGSSTTDPFKGSTVMDGFPGVYLQRADIGTMRLGDSNGDGALDLYAVSPGQSFLSGHTSSLSGGLSYGIGVGPVPYYLANPSQNGCPTSADRCLPDPLFNSLGVQQGYPVTGGFNSQNILETADLNSDGIPDIATVGYTSRGVSISLGSSGGDFDQGTLYEVGSFVTQISGTATNGSNQITGVASLGSPAVTAGQLLIANGLNSGTTILNITGSGPYILTLSSNFTGSSGSITINAKFFKDNRPQSLTLADFDQDGITDMVVVGVDVTQGANLGVGRFLKGNGDGTMQSPTNIDGVVGGCLDPRAVSAIDIDLDGRPEIAVLCYTSQQIFVSRRFVSASAPGGTWITSATNINATGTGTQGIAMKWGRLTSGGASGVDMAVAGLDTTRSMRIISGVTISNISTVNGTFTLSVGTLGPYHLLYGFPSDLEFADLDSDGRADLVIPMQRQNGSTISGSTWFACTSTADGVCSPQGWGADGVLGNAVTSGDIDSDGQPDLFISFAADRMIFRTIARVLNISY
jgi:hypothetical protein